LAIYFFTVETIWLQRLYVLFFIELGSRRAHVAGCAPNPSATWFVQQALPSRENALHHILVDGNNEREGDVVRDPWTSAAWVPLLHVDDGGDDVLTWTLGARPRRPFGREEPAIFPLCRRSMKVQHR